MNRLAPAGMIPSGLPTLVSASGPEATVRFVGFFASTIRNPNTRRAYARAVADFCAWCSDGGARSIADVKPLHVAAWVELQTRERAAPTAARRHLFDWLANNLSDGSAADCSRFQMAGESLAAYQRPIQSIII